MSLGPPLGADDRILVRIPSWLGDAVMAEPAIGALYEERRRQRAASRLSLAGPQPLLAVYDGLFPEAQRLPHLGRGGERARGPNGWSGHDVAVLLTGSFRSAWTAWRAGIPRRVGWARDGRAALLTDALRPPLERGRVSLGVGLPGRSPRLLPRPFGTSCVELLGLLGLSVARRRPRLALAGPARGAVARRMHALDWSAGRDYVVANVGSREHSTKALPPETWRAVLRNLHGETGLATLLFCGPGEERRTAELARSLDDIPVVAVIEPPAGLPEFTAWSAGARLVLTTDSGPRHLAAAAGARVLVVAGPTDPRHTAEHTRLQRLVRRDVPCGPCHLERCPRTGTEEHICMRSLDPRHIVDTALELLG